MVVPIIKEASGIADSKNCVGYLWAQEDSGHPPLLYLIAHDGKVVNKVFLKGAVNRDWEDMALAGNDLYLADIGDNNENYLEYTIYQLAEPSFTSDTITNFKTIRFRYPDGAHNAEAFLVDPQTKDIFLITKHQHPSYIYKLTYPYSFTTVNTATLVGKLPYKGVVSAALSPDGKGMIIKTYFHLRYYSRKPGTTIEAALRSDYSKILYWPEPQGEAVTFAQNNQGFFTLSEKGFAKKVRLRFYKW